MTSTDELVLQLLIDRNLVDDASVQAVRADFEAHTTAEKLATKTLKHLIDQGSVTQDQVVEVLADEYGITVANLDDLRVSTEALEALPVDLAKRYKVFPLEVDDNEMVLAVSDPLNMDVIDNISHVINRSVVIQVAPMKGIEKAIEHHQKALVIAQWFSLNSSGWFWDVKLRARVLSQPSNVS